MREGFVFHHHNGFKHPVVHLPFIDIFIRYKDLRDIIHEFITEEFKLNFELVSKFYQRLFSAIRVMGKQVSYMSEIICLLLYLLIMMVLFYSLNAFFIIGIGPGFELLISF